MRVWFVPLRRLLTAGSALSVAIVGLIALPAQPATAATRFLANSLTAYTDSAEPKATFPLDYLGEAPIGSWLDAEGDKHVSRGYYTFDLTSLAGRQITKATMSLRETAVTDCARPRAIEVWRVAATTTAPTWKKAPRQLTRVGELAPATAAECPSRYLYADVAAVLRAAQQERADVVTLLLRVPADQEGLTAAGRRVANVGIQTEDNVAPGVPTRLSVNGVACTGDLSYISTATPELRATVDDPDYPDNPFERLTATFAYWPVDRPAERVEWNSYEVSTDSDIRYTLPTALTQNVTYEFAVRATDRAGATSAWTSGCRFTVDTVRPGAPTIASTDYPTDKWAGGPGIPGTFTFTVAPGDTDAQFFRWSVHGVSENTPVDPNGTATLRYTPTEDGPVTMSVTVYDRALNRSDTVTYWFMVQRTDPNLDDQNPAGGLNEPRTIVLSPGMPDVVEYTYWLNDGPHTTVPAGADGTATITVTPDRVGDNHLYATTRTSTGLPSGQLDYWIHVRTAPTLTSPDFPADGGGEPPLVGERVTLQFHPGMAGVTEYVWRINRHGQRVTPAGPDGTATVQWTEQDVDYLNIEVSTRTADGLESEPNSYFLALTSHAPAVESADYPEWIPAGGPGVTGTFTFRPAREGVTSYTWRLNDGPEHTLPASADGTAILTWTPTAEQTGYQKMTVREHIGDIASNLTWYEFEVAEPEQES